MFKKILIANRGEIALRIIRCCKEMHIETVLVYSKPDKNSLPVMLADESICIGADSVSETYLNQDLLVDIALRSGCDALHPGYGFLSENADFAEKCRAEGIVFIGPSPELIRTMGDKQAAKDLAKSAGVPLVPGSKTILSSEEDALKEAEKIGYPVLIKASAGGGGKGMRAAGSDEELIKGYREAVFEASSAFGCGDVYLEKLIENPRHIEVQIAADKYGNVIHLGERNCSIQKNHQKILEESPAMGITKELRDELCSTAVKAAVAAGYDSVGTVEFLLDKNNNFYFIEMNTRIQVEHPVTEMVCGIDLIKLQIIIAAGKELPYKQSDITFNGCAIECRINAKSTGKINFLHFPQGFGMRIESALYQGDEISPLFDSMIGKIIVSAGSRLEAVARMRRAIEELVIDGVETNMKELYVILHIPEFVRGNYDTSFWEQKEPMIKDVMNQEQ